jgi:endonuclease/exonuclease/phosphatase family metal-dependent hydrolase
MTIVIAAAIVIPTTLIVLKDETPPTVTIKNPINGYSYTGLVLIEIEAEDDSTIALIEAFIDNVLVQEVEKEDYLSFFWDTDDYVDGFHNITAKATDKAGNVDSASIICTFDGFENPPPDDEFKVLNYNIKESGVGEDWLEVVKAENADIIVFVETGTWSIGGDRKLNDVINKLNAHFFTEAPYEGYTTQGNTFSTTGEAILSRYPILQVNQLETVTLDDATVWNPAHDFLDVIVNVQGKFIHIIGYHLKCCEGTLEESRRNYEQEGIINYMDGLGDVPIMYVGDLNSLSPADVGDTTRGPNTDYGYGPATMMLDPDDETYGNFSSTIHNFTDVWKSLHPSEWGHTFNIPGYQARIDYTFVNQHLNNSIVSSNIGSGTGLDNSASDHYTVDAVFSIANISSSPAPQSIQKQRISQLAPVDIKEDQKTEEQFTIEFYLHVNWVKKLRFF